MGDDEPDPVVVLMDAARWAAREANHAREAASDAASAEGRAAADAAATAYSDTAAELRGLARWLDGDSSDPPASVVLGEARRGTTDGVPWRDARDE